MAVRRPVRRLSTLGFGGRGGGCGLKVVSISFASKTCHVEKKEPSIGSFREERSLPVKSDACGEATAGSRGLGTQYANPGGTLNQVQHPTGSFPCRQTLPTYRGFANTSGAMEWNVTTANLKAQCGWLAGNRNSSRMIVRSCSPLACSLNIRKVAIGHSAIKHETIVRGLADDGS